MSDGLDPRVRSGMARLLELADGREATGDRIVGWKVAFGSTEGMRRLSLTEPLVGFLASDAVVDSGTVVDIGRWTAPAAEPELAVHLGASVPAGADESLVRSAIAGIGPAIEIADVDRPPEDVETILSGNVYQRNVVFGPVDRARAGAALGGLTARLLVNGTERASTTDVESNTGSVVALVGTVARTLGALDRTLEGGQVVIAGSVVPPLAVAPGDEVVFHLEPLEPISVRFG